MMVFDFNFYLLSFSRPSISLQICRCPLSLSDLAMEFVVKHEQVFSELLNYSYFSTSTYLIKEQANAQVFRVYIYPIKLSVLRYVRFFLYFPSSSESEIWCITCSTIYLHIYKISGSYTHPELLSIFCGYMAVSPNSVLDGLLLREAESICLEERTSHSLVQALHLTLAGKLFTSRRPSVANLTLFASRIWDCTHRLSCYDHGGPWHINGDLLLISRMNPSQSIEQLSFSFTKLWVRCYDLPPMCFTLEYAQAIGNSLGNYCETDLPPEDPNEAKLLVRKIPTVRKYLRVKFIYNLHSPLKRTQSVKTFNPIKNLVEEHISRLTYERLPHTCFRCGHLGHLVEGCSFEGPLIYGDWIRAEKFYRLNFQNHQIPNVVSIPKTGQVSSSTDSGHQVTQVTNAEDLFIAVDPSIIRADYSSVRAKGPLPISKGKAPMLPEFFNMAPIEGNSSSSLTSSMTVFGPTTSILGPGPMMPQGPLIGPDPILDNEECQFVSYFNSASHHGDLYSPNAHRRLFKEDLVLPAFSPSSKSQCSPPNLESPIKPVEVPVNFVPSAAAQISKVFSEEIKKLPTTRKRAPGNPLMKPSDTPRAKRGRQTSNPDNQG